MNPGIKNQLVLWPNIVLVTLLLSACTTLSSESRKQIISTDTVKVSMREPEIKVDAPILSRPPAGAYIAAGIGEGIAGIGGSGGGAGALLAIPIMVPLGAIVGAASIPSDKKWSKMSAEYERRQRLTNHRAEVAASSGFEKRFERAIVRELSRKNDFWNPCIQSPFSSGKCRYSSDSASISLRLRQRFAVNTISSLTDVSDRGSHEILAEVIFRPASGVKTLTACGYFNQSLSNEPELAPDTSEWIDFIAKRFIDSIRLRPTPSSGGIIGPNGAIGPDRITRPASDPSDYHKKGQARKSPRINGYGNFYWVDRPSCEWPK